MNESKAFLKLLWGAQRRERSGIPISLSKSILERVTPHAEALIARLREVNKLKDEDVELAIGVIPYSEWIIREGAEHFNRLTQEMYYGKILRKEVDEELNRLYEEHQGIAHATRTGRPPDEERVVWSCLFELLIERSFEALMTEINGSPPVTVEKDAKLKSKFRGIRKASREDSEAAHKALGWQRQPATSRG